MVIIMWNVMSLEVKECIEVLEMLNTSRPSDASMRQYPMSSLVQLMACRLLGAKPLPEQNAD